MDIKEIVNSKGVKVAVVGAHSAQDIHLMQSIAQSNNMAPMSDTGSERGTSPHGSEHSRYSAPRYNHLGGMNGGPNDMRYPSPTAMQSPLPMMQQPYRHENSFNSGMMQQENLQPPRPTEQQKAFPCSTCGKGFARRSDLARHERIHSGIRPHVCDHPGCGKQFIQRSALTVHMRVHTGEKPHMCERCSKPFSDSSSLARHRRIHSGKRPYQCPYADCQKTFTRRTTLTRHQNHHTGTVEEAAAATAAVLATRTGSSRGGGRRSDGESFTGSPISTPSPGRHLTASPNSELAPMSGMPRHTPEYPYGSMNNSSVPIHLRGEYHVANQAPPTTATFSNGMRPTSHPSGYAPPPSILEPPANMEQRQSGSASGSPHMSHASWNSPSPHMPSPPPANYAYPDPDPYTGQMGINQQHLFYQNSNMRRPQSTEPDQYDMKTRMNGSNEMWTAAQ